MRWIGRRGSSNVEDRRGLSGGSLITGGGVIGVIFLVVQFFLSGDPTALQQQIQQTGQSPMSANEQAADDSMAQFVSVILADCEDVWIQIFKEQGKTYQVPKLVLFREATESGCGYSSAATGPFYCPDDNKVYIDLSFFQEMRDRFHVAGDFPMAYVIAHEVGHHVQFLMGTFDRVSRLQQQSSESANKYSVAIELQADFYAGVWAHYVDQNKHVLDNGDIEEALNAANAIGDDRLQKESQGRVQPDAFTHGTSQQRMYWFK
ncbi:MAG: neutral zinc metallopeptidase, partial [Chitinophagales bacterium]|nr:neutral zinc metallopeptidase [Chitinophagales bacterium]